MAAASNHICFTVTNELRYDQRMQRIARTLSEAGYRVTLVGYRFKDSPPLPAQPYRQRRLRCWFRRGKLFYAEYNLRLFFYLLFHRPDVVGAVDLDTIVPCYYASRIRGCRRICDAHELFTGLKEVVTRPRIRRIWEWVERRYLPRFPHGYTVSESIAEEFQRRYGIRYATIRNLPVYEPWRDPGEREPFLLYQGFVNEGRCFEYLVPALRRVPLRLVVAGDGHFMPRLKELIRENGVEDRVELKGMLTPEELRQLTRQAWAGLTLAENQGLNQYLALPNKYFDYIQAGIPQLAMNFPEYRRHNDHREVAVLIDSPDPDSIAAALNNLLNDRVLYNRLRQNCLLAREELHWNAEAEKLLSFYRSLFSS